MSNLWRQKFDKQNRFYMPRAERFQILGYYCQTELGHGSNYEESSPWPLSTGIATSFTIYSPTLSGTKYWIGAAGVWATHGIVVVRHII
ncbi:uncharacterized protein A1O5_05007 [Cladophialophora psammophila CBS 110553]|uniref:Acyl-CoA oxidase n=1 Tax=Cladophialophora psammophila CBS 110553 TaxID=1182543 RepID=W9WWC1_9EURO|nr:uncharacterized protein A1O5_05007 [Cladophialophora psammophila CBS 110553]EXJ72502.1 hypothetical protein A1O5_05007 [Cladophialophora psammophila CBS 110553]